MSPDKLSLLAKDLAVDFPRSPRDALAGYVIAARTLDKCRAMLNGTAGEYRFDCPLDRHFFDFAELDSKRFQDFVGTGATDHEVAAWITAHARSRPRIEIIQWNNRLREMRISELPEEAQEYLEDYINRFVPRNRVVRCWFDVYDLEEQRI